MSRPEKSRFSSRTEKFHAIVDDLIRDPTVEKLLGEAFLAERERLECAFADLARATVVNPEANRAAALMTLGKCEYVADLLKHLYNKRRNRSTTDA